MPEWQKEELEPQPLHFYRPFAYIFYIAAVVTMHTNFKINSSSLQRIADRVPAIIGLYNINTGQYLYANKAVTKILGYAPQEFTRGGLPFVASLVHPDDITGLMEKNQRALDEANMNAATSEEESIAEFEYRMKHKNGGWRWLRTDGTVFSRSEDGKVDLVLNVSLDVTDRRQAEAHLKTSLQALDDILSVP